MSDAVRLFLRRVVIDQAFPPELKGPHVQIRVAMDESGAMMTSRRARSATSTALFADLEKTAASKRASLPQAAKYTKASLKDWQRLTHSGCHDMARLKKAMLLIANDAHLGREWLGRALKGDQVVHWECRIGGDFPLIDQVETRLQTRQKKSFEIFTADTLISHRYAGKVPNPGKARKAAVLNQGMGNTKAKT